MCFKKTVLFLQALHQLIIYFLEEVVGFVYAPFGEVHELDVVVEFFLSEVLLGGPGHIEGHDPAILFAYLIVPFLVIFFVAAVEIEYVLCDQYVFVNAFLVQEIHHFALHFHDIVLDGIVPFADEFYDGEIEFVIGVNDLHVQRTAAKIIPLRMDIIIVDRLRKFKLAVFPSVKRGTLVFFRNIYMPPVVEWFDFVHI
jgi:hypothetical protein